MLSVASHYSYPSTDFRRRLVVRRLFRVPPCRTGFIHFQTSMLFPEHELMFYGSKSGLNGIVHRLSGIRVREADSCAVGSGFESSIRIPDFSSSSGSTLELLDARMEQRHELHRTVMEVDNMIARCQRAQRRLNYAYSSFQRLRLRNRIGRRNSRVIQPLQSSYDDEILDSSSSQWNLQRSFPPLGNYSYTSESLYQRLIRVNDPTIRYETELSGVESNLEKERDFKVAQTHANVPYNARCDGYDRERH
ncbi:hypothetical protein TNCV_4833021 [Trichonephila clavipes]|nr:hypothetical protein TNCV_4833021 [Trichonephila clavipes]